MLAALAHLASLIEARPCVLYLLQLAHEAGVNIPSVISTYDSGIIGAKEDCFIRLTPTKPPLLLSQNYSNIWKKYLKLNKCSLSG